MTFSYKGRQSSPKEIAEEIQGQIISDGKLTNSALRSLCTIRKRRFLSRTLLENLPKVSLDDAVIRKIRKNYTTVEEFIDAGEEALMSISSDEELFLLKATQLGLKRQLEEEYDG